MGKPGRSTRRKPNFSGMVIVNHNVEKPAGQILCTMLLILPVKNTKQPKQNEMLNSTGMIS
ncbi:hypothetical protein DPMN_081234 [Dreissena polymorpha]|uniref:Uncharacterized protein n=1 Tax=Dreissena polymorpha TaxID=45954 RepID=A0A9D3Y707_DREPO|nr:hypothetical protein DPMN_081234 [Dreissena polymorpha]